MNRVPCLRLAAVGFSVVLVVLPLLLVPTPALSLSSPVESNGPSINPSVSDEGDVAFESTASNIVVGDTNSASDAFVRQSDGQTVRVSVDSTDAEANGSSFRPSLSTDGRFVAFESTASNLDPDDTNNVSDIILRDLFTGTSTRVSVDSFGNQATNGSFHPTVSQEGRYIAFASDAPNLVPGDTNAARDIFLRDTLAATTTRISVASSGSQGSGPSFRPAISGDGRYVAFHSDASNLVSGDTNGLRDIFVHDIQTGATTRVSVDSSGVQSNGTSQYPAISADGTHISFTSDATNLVAGDTNGKGDVFVHDMGTGTTVRASIDSSGIQGNDLSYYSSLSGDGHYVAFNSFAKNLVPSDANNAGDIFVKDLASGAVSLASAAPSSVQGNASSTTAAISPNATYVAFSSTASNFVTDSQNPLASDGNGVADVFLRLLADSAISRSSAPSDICDAACAEERATSVPSAPTGLATTVTAWDPVVHAIYTDPSGATGQVLYSLQDSSGNQIGSDIPGLTVPSGHDSAADLTDELGLEYGETYTWSAQATNGVNISAATSPPQPFVYSPSLPNDVSTASDPLQDIVASDLGVIDLSTMPDDPIDMTPIEGGTLPDPIDLAQPTTDSGQDDTAMGVSQPASADASATSFEGPTWGGYPADPSIAAGPSNLVMAINHAVFVYSKEGTVIKQQSLRSFFNIPSGFVTVSDPWAIYHSLGGHFFLSMTVKNPNPSSQAGRIYFARSETNNAARSWHRYVIDVNECKAPCTPTHWWADAPKIGINGQALFITANMYDFGDGFQQANLWAFQLSNLTASREFPKLKNYDGSIAASVQPALTLGDPGKEYMVDRYGGSYFTIWRLTCCPIELKHTVRQDVPDFKTAPSAPQFGSPGSSPPKIDTGGSRLQGAIFRQGHLWTAQTVLTSKDHSTAVRGEDILTSCIHRSDTANTKTVTYGDSHNFYYYPRVATNSNGAVVMVADTSSSTTYASVAWAQATTRATCNNLSAQDGWGTMSVHKPGTGVVPLQKPSLPAARFGDYSGAAPDPDGTTNWIFSEYGNGTGHGGTFAARV